MGKSISLCQKSTIWTPTLDDASSFVTCRCSRSSHGRVAWRRPRRSSASRSPQSRRAFGRVLLAGGAAAFDSLKQTMKEIELLSDPTRGEVRIGCPETVAALLPPIIEKYSHLRPGVSLLVREVVAPTLDIPLLREREIDLAIVRVAGEPARHRTADELQVETLFDDELLIVVGADSQWARRTRPSLADLANEGWILPPANTLTSEVIMKAFHEHNLGAPRVSLVTFSVSLRINLVSSGRYVTVLPKSIMSALVNRASLKPLSIRLPAHQWPVILATLKNRLLNSAAQHFIETLKSGTSRPLD